MGGVVMKIQQLRWLYIIYNVSSFLKKWNLKSTFYVCIYFVFILFLFSLPQGGEVNLYFKDVICGFNLIKIKHDYIFLI